MDGCALLHSTFPKRRQANEMRPSSGGPSIATSNGSPWDFHGSRRRGNQESGHGTRRKCDGFVEELLQLSHVCERLEGRVVTWHNLIATKRSVTSEINQSAAEAETYTLWSLGGAVVGELGGFGCEVSLETIMPYSVSIQSCIRRRGSKTEIGI